MKPNIFALLMMLSLSVTPALAAERQMLHGHVPRVIRDRNLQPVGRLPAEEQLSLVIGLPLRNQDAFSNLLQQMYDPASPQYHQYLTPRQIAEQFGPTEQDYQAVAAFAQSNGLQVVGTHADHTLVRVSGAVSNIEKTFHVTMRIYQHPTESRTFYAPDAEPSLDLTVPVLRISGMNNYSLPRPAGHVGTTPSGGGSATPGAGSGPSGEFSGNDYRTAYVPRSTLNGAGQSVGLLELDGFYTNDIKKYETNAYAATNRPTVPVTSVLVDSFDGVPSSDGNSVGEVSLDIEMAFSMAPGLSNVLVYEADNCCYTWLDILKQMQEDNIAKQLSCSWLFDDDEPNADVVYKEFAMQGQSFFQCSGDYQAFYNGVAQWTDDPNVTLVGGTMLTTSASQAWASETAWSNGGGIGTGGGVSASFMGDFAIPSWQQGINMSLNRGSTNNRNVPDVSLVAYHCYVVWNNGTTGWWWGTSIAAPLWAGYASLANQQAVSFGEPTVGFLNPALYSIGKSQLYNSCFHDVKTGNNTNANTANLYFAVTSYDLCTGWGTPAGTNLLNALTEPFISGTIRNPNGSVTLTSATPANFSSRVLAATNLTSAPWLPIYTNITGGAWQFTDTNAALYRSRFYRVSQP